MALSKDVCYSYVLVSQQLVTALLHTLTQYINPNDQLAFPEHLSNQADYTTFLMMQGMARPQQED